MRWGLVGGRGYQRTRMIECWYNAALQFRMRWHDKFVIYLRALLFWEVNRGEEDEGLGRYKVVITYRKRKEITLMPMLIRGESTCSEVIVSAVEMLIWIDQSSDH